MHASPTSIGAADAALLADCFAFDHMVIDGSAERRTELSMAAHEGRMRVATRSDRAVGYSVVAPWFLGAPFLALLYADPDLRGRGIGARLLDDFEEAHGSAGRHIDERVEHAHAALAEASAVDAVRNADRLGRGGP